MMTGGPERENFPTFESVWATGTGKDGSQRKLEVPPVTWNDSSPEEGDPKDKDDSEDEDVEKTSCYSLFSPGISARALWSVSAPDAASKSEVAEAWKCEECSHENYHENEGECEICGTGICFMDERKNNLRSVERRLFVAEYGVDEDDDDDVSPIKSSQTNKTSSLRELLSRHPSFQQKPKKADCESMISWASAATTPTANLSPASAFSPVSSEKGGSCPEVRVIDKATEIQEKRIMTFNKTLREETDDMEKSRRHLRSARCMSPPVLLLFLAVGITFALWIHLHKIPAIIDEGSSTTASLMDGLWLPRGESVFGDEPDYETGASVALARGGNLMAVGVGKFGPVRAYILDETDEWVQHGQDILLSDGPKHVALSRKYGHTLAIASESDGSVGVFAYDKSIDEWAPLGEPLLFGVTNRDDARASVSLSDTGKVLAVGVPSEGSLRSDSVRVLGYDRNTSKWIPVGKDVILDAEARIQHGGSVSLSANGMVLAVGSWSEGSTRATYASHAEVYRFFNNTWQQVGGRNDIGSRTSPTKSDTSVSLSEDGNIVAIGSGSSCRIFQFVQDNCQWSQLGQDLYGMTVSLSANGHVLAVGNPASDDNGSNAGEATIYVYDEDGNSWEQVGESIPGEVEGDFFGAALAISDDGTRVAVGSPGSGENAENSGSVAIFDLD